MHHTRRWLRAGLEVNTLLAPEAPGRLWPQLVSPRTFHAHVRLCSRDFLLRAGQEEPTEGVPSLPSRESRRHLVLIAIGKHPSAPP